MTDAFYVAFPHSRPFPARVREGAFSQAFVQVLATCKRNAATSGEKLVDRGDAAHLDLIVVCAIGVIAAPPMVWAIGSGLKKTPEGFEAAVVMTRWMFPYIGFMSLVALAGGISTPGASSRCRPRRPGATERGADPLHPPRRAPVPAARHRADLRAVRGVMVGVLQLALQFRPCGLGMLPRIGASACGDPRGLDRPDDAQDRETHASGADRRQRGADLASHQYADRVHLAPGSVTWVTMPIA